jgi:serine protease Do
MKAAKVKYLIISLVIVLTLLFSVSCSSQPENGAALPSDTGATSTETPIEPGWTPPATDNGALALPSIADVVALVKPSVVAINTEYTGYDMFNQPYQQEGAGSGWILDENGFIVTNNHVVEGAQNVTVTLADGRTFPAEDIRTDWQSDLAIIKVNATGLPAASVGNSDELRVGDWVVAIGNSLGLGISATKGIISAKGVSISMSEEQTIDDLLQTDAAINPGNSGGPLVNIYGEVIGITSIKVSLVGVEGMGYAISVNTAVPIIQQLVQAGYVVRPFLGVQNMITVDATVAEFYDLSTDHGALVRGIVAGGPAELAGLEAGDVITGFDDHEISNVNELLDALYSSEVGQTVLITFWRGASEQSLQLTLAETPPSP